MLPARLRLPMLVLAAGLVLGYGVTTAWPTRYAASAMVLVDGTRTVKIRHAASDPQTAAALVKEALGGYVRGKAVVVDDARVVGQRPSLALNLALGGAAGLAFGIAAALRRERRRRLLRCERDLLESLGEPLLAARPLRPEALRELCEQLLASWFSPQRRALAVVSAGAGDGRTRLAAELAACFAQMGEKTLLVDGDFRSPGQHRMFSLRNRLGLADFLDGGKADLASSGENLCILVAGSSRADPLALLGEPRLPAFLAEAGRHFRVVLIDTPAAARGPDFEMFAALAGGVLVVARRDAELGSLERLHRALERCAARVVATLLA